MPLSRARIVDIAKKAGVSIGTVDRVMHNRGEVAEKTRKRILKIAEELNYSPNVFASSLKLRRTFNLISLLPEATADNSYWNKHSNGISLALKELAPFPVNLIEITFDLNDENDFQEKTKKVLELKPEGVLLAPIFKSQSIQFCSELKNRKTPFVFIDGYIPETSFLAYIGENIYQSGRVAGQLIDIITPQDKDILILNIAKNLQNVNHLTNRTKGFLSYFPKSGINRGKKIKLGIPDSSPDTIKNSIDKILSDNPKIASIFITGSKSHKIASYLSIKGINSINLIGYDLLDTNVEYLRSGIIRFLIGQRPEEQAYKGIKKLFDFLSFNKVPGKMEYLPIDIVTSENVDFFLNNNDNKNN